MSIRTTAPLIFTIIFISLSFLGNQAMASQTTHPNLGEALLQKCPDKPNCINTEFPGDTTHYLPAIDFPDSRKDQLIAQAKSVILKMGGTIIKEDKHSLSATFTSSLFKFVDDFELRQDNATHKLHIRSASRTGYSDFGVNKRRVKKFSEQFKIILDNK